MCQLPEPARISTPKTLYIILGLGFVVRVVAAYVQPAFLDEGFVYQVTRAGFQAMLDVLRNDTHAPTYNLLMYPLVQLTDSIFWLRMPAVVLSLATLWLSFALSRRFLSEKASLATTAFLALSYSVWLTDAQLRSYGPLAFLQTALLLGFVDIERQGQPFPRLPKEGIRWLLFFATALLASTLHMLGTLLVGVLWLFSLRSRSRKRLLIGLSLAIIPTVIWFAWSHSTGTMTYSQEATKTFSLQFINTPLYILNGKTPGDIANYLNGYLKPGSWTKVLAAFYIVANVLIWLIWLRGWKIAVQRWGREGWLLSQVFLLPLVAVLISCILGLQPFAPRYAVPMSLPFVIVCAQALSPIWRLNLWQLATGWTLLLSLAFPFCPALWNQYWVPALKFINEQARPGDVICTYNPCTMYALAMAYDPQGASFKFGYRDQYFVVPVHDPQANTLPIFPLNQANLIQLYDNIAPENRVFLVICQREQGDGALEKIPFYYALANSTHFHSLTYWADVEVQLLVRRPTPLGFPAGSMDCQSSK